MSTERRAGFTLIEVMGALIIFSLGVLMTLNLTDSLSEQLARAAIRSEIMARARTSLDSLEAEGFGGVSVGSVQRNFTAHGRSYRETLQVSSFSPLVLQVTVAIDPVSGVRGPSHSLTSYLSGDW
jgi:prepilin-type N-terminal cleavage/methylation domain-containing protein